ncbi:MAG: glycosyltransferase family 4 protein [Planctomycetota bacterium]
MNRAYPPGVEATGQYLQELAADLGRRHDVAVICGVPYSNGLEGQVFPYRVESSGAVEVRRAWGTRLPKRAPLGRIANQASFFAMAGLAARRVERPDVVVSMTDPPFLGLLGLRLKRRFGVPFVYYSEDLYPDVAEAVGMAPRPLAAAFRRVQAAMLSGADHIVALSDDMAMRLEEKGVKQERMTVIRNWADTEAIRPIKKDNPFRERHGLNGRFVVMYSGNFGYVWDLDLALDVAARFREDPRIAFVLIGEGSTRPRVEARVRKERLSNVRLLPYQSEGGLAESLSVLASGTPMAALAEPGSEAARVVRDHECGWCSAPGDVGGLADFIHSASLDGTHLRAMGHRGRSAAESVYARTIMTRKFEEVLQSVVNERSARHERRMEGK